MMAGVHASEAVSGHFLDPTITALPAQGATNITGLNNEAAVLPSTGPRAYLDVSAAALAASHPLYGAEGVYTNGRYREHSSPRIGSGSRDNSAERSHGGSTPCGIMKVGFMSF